jgi:ArsR family transcriptional regulator, arsenate/arsenite/antimonite-responsive transcriptional repressor
MSNMFNTPEANASMVDSVKVFKALGDPTRLRIVRLLFERPLCVCELVFVLKMEQSRVSHHLQILREVGLVEDNREGRWMIYAIPANRREVFDAFLKLALKDDRESYRAFRRDLAELDICLQDDVRGKKCAPVPSALAEKTIPAKE